MKIISLKLLLCLVCSSLGVLDALAASSQLNAVWTDPLFDRAPLQKTLIIAYTDNAANRQKFEKAFVAVIRKAGGKAEASFLLLPSGAEITRAAIKEALDGKEFDSILVSRLISIDFGTAFINKDAETHIDQEIQSDKNNTLSPEYFKKTTNVIIQTKIFDTSGKLIWRAESETFAANSVDNLVRSIAKAMGRDLTQKGLIKKTTSNPTNY